MMSDDMALVREFVTRRSESVFTALVERHIGLVHSAALRQVRDPHLAEEIAQSVFVLLARKASKLGPTTVLSAWLYRATGYLAADALKAQRRRLRREQEAQMPPSLNDSVPDPWEELAPLLDDAMAQLGDADRTAIVLRYFENKTAREIASALRTKESAAQKRVTRALEKLRHIFGRRGVVVPAGVLAGTLSAHAIQAAPAGLSAAVSLAAADNAVGMVGLGLGAKLVGALGKAFPFSWLTMLLPMLGTLPSLWFVSKVGRIERSNFRDAEGFRSRLHRNWMRSVVWGFPVLLLAIVVINRLTEEAGGVTARQWLMGTLLIIAGLTALRSLAIARNWFQMAMFGYAVVLVTGLTAGSLGWLPSRWSQVPMLLAMTLLFFVIKHRPARMDYSLFLRAARGLLAEAVDESLRFVSPRACTRPELLAFARFLGARYLVVNYRWRRDGLLLRLPPVRPRWLTNMSAALIPPVGRRGSTFLLGYDGSVATHCAATDMSDLAALPGQPSASALELEQRTELALRKAWFHFREGEHAASARELGEVPVSTIFKVRPEQARAARWWQAFVGGTVLLLLTLNVLLIWRPPWLDQMRPAKVTEPEVRAFLNDVRDRDDPRQANYNDPGTALFSCLVLPPTNLFTATGLRAMRDAVAGGKGFDDLRTLGYRAQLLWSAPLPRHALIQGWITWQELDLQPGDVNAALRRSRPLGPKNWDILLGRCQAWSWVQQQQFQVLRMQWGGVLQLRLLQTINCLDLVPRDPLVRHIASGQVLSPTPPDQPRLHHWREMRGLFFTPCFPALQDTFYALAALQILDGLDQIDREACIRGILRRHGGGGYFTSPDTGGYNEYHIDGSVHDTIAAFESLRILNALERVPDLDAWQFRLQSSHHSQPKADGRRRLTWEEVEAWAAQRRLAEILREKKQHPEQPFRSLLPALEMNDRHGR